MALLDVADVTVRYGNVAAVTDASFAVEAGEVVGVLGPNGAGKSTLLAAVAGLVGTAAGSVSFDGAPMRRRPASRRARDGMALVAEGRGVLGPISVEENLRLGAYPCGRLRADELARRLEDAYELFGVLRERAQQPAGVLSGGEAAMLVVARALMSHPRLLLLDEPTLGLAPRTGGELFARLATLKQRGTTMVVVEQKAADVLELADRVIVMRGGRLVEQAAAREVTVDSLRSLYFGDAKEAA